MVTFTVTYRSSSGEKRECSIEAADRNDCFTKCKAKGIAVVSMKVESGKLRAGGSETRHGGSKHSTLNRKLSAVAVVLLAIGVGFWLWNGKDIKENDKTPAVKKANVSKPKVTKRPVEKPADPGTNEVVRTIVKRELTTQEKLDRLEQSLTNAYKAAAAKKIRFMPSKRRQNRIFTEISDLQIQRLLSIEPGRLALGAPNYDRFVENFRKSLNTPIVINEDDSEETKMMKEAVIETRKDLERRMNAGEDIAQVMKDTEAELQRMASYRLNLEFEMRKARHDGDFSSDDLKDYVQAANTMLKENGLPELKFPEMWYQNAKLRQMKGNEK
jgi:hypothetical protein